MKLLSSLFITSSIALVARAEEKPAVATEAAKKTTEVQPQDADKRRAEMQERLKNLPPEVREILKSLSPETREKLRSMSPEERQAAIAELRKKYREAHPESGDKKAVDEKAKPGDEAKPSDEMKNRRAEMLEKMTDMSPEERQAFIEKMKQRREQREGKDAVQEGGVIPKRP